MLERLHPEHERASRELDSEFVVEGLSLYGLASVVTHIGVPGLLSFGVVLALFGVLCALWIERRSELNAESDLPAAPRRLRLIA